MTQGLRDSQKKKRYVRDQVKQSPYWQEIRDLLQARWKVTDVFARLCREHGPGYPYPKAVKEDDLWNNYLIPSEKSIQRYAFKMRELALKPQREKTAAAIERAMFEGIEREMFEDMDPAAASAQTANVMYVVWRDAETGKWKVMLFATEE